MDEPVFDAMLKTALEEALKQDLEELERQTEAVQPSARHRRRMRRMLADPNGYYRRMTVGEEAAVTEQTYRRKKNPARWAAAAVIAAMLVIPAAANVLQGGEFFRRMFNESYWAKEYIAAADTEQLLEMGGGNVGTVVEDEHFRLELLDAVSEGENALAAVKITAFDTELLEREFGEVTIPPGRFLRKDGTFLETGSYSVRCIYADQDETLEDNQFCLIFHSSRNHAAENRHYTITLRDFGYYSYESDEDVEGEEIVLVPGSWTLSVELGFDGGEVLQLDQEIQLENCSFTVETVTLSAMSVGMVIHCPEAEVNDVWETLGKARLRMKDGTEVSFTGSQMGGRGEVEDGFASDVLLEFPMPLARDQFESLLFGERELTFEGN